jgi:hypothetical protein
MNIHKHGREGYLQYYGYHFNPVAPNFSRCGERVCSNDRSMRPSQCSRKATCQPDSEGRPTRCKQHSDAFIQEKREKQKRKDEARRRERNALLYERGLEQFISDPRTKALQAIADGHNDPRSLARKALKSAEPVAPPKDT